MFGYNEDERKYDEDERKYSYDEKEYINEEQMYDDEEKKYKEEEKIYDEEEGKYSGETQKYDKNQKNNETKKYDKNQKYIEDQKDNEKDNEKQKKTVKITLFDTEGNEIMYEVKKYIPLKKILENYCKTKNKNIGSLFMTMGGEPVDLHKNSEELFLEDGCEINVVSRQSGG
ncbi:SUMO protein smt3 [Binucleata daphniae]